MFLQSVKVYFGKGVGENAKIIFVEMCENLIKMNKIKTTENIFATSLKY